jgi:glycosyltransferase involved in cell wall biosynthesis
MTPLQSTMISIIIPTFNRAGYLREAIQSVLEQDYFSANPYPGNYELLIMDDGSSDNTKDVVGSFGKKVNYSFQKNKGVSSARNRGLNLTKGEFVAFLDSDDLWKKQKLTAQMAFMFDHPEAMICCTEEIWIRKGIFVNPRKKHRKYSLFRRELFEKIGIFDEELLVCEDYDLGIRIAQKYKMHFISEPLIVKRGGHSDQLSKKYWGMDRFRVRALEKALCLDLTSQQKQQVKQEMAKKCKILVNGFEKHNKNIEAEKYYSIMNKYGL